MIVITLSINQYKEKDAIVNAVCEGGTLTFLAKGVYDQKSTNFAINNVLSIFDITLREGNYKYPILKSAKILYSPLKIDQDLTALGGISLILEATNKILAEEEKSLIFNDLSLLIKNYHDSDNRYFYILIYLSKLLKYSGYQFNVNSCVKCHRKDNILDFSLISGGFLCKDCFKDEQRSGLTHEQMFLLRDAFNADHVNTKSNHYSFDNCLSIFELINVFLMDNLGVNLKSLSLIRK